MSLKDKLEPTPRKTMILFFVLDTSGSMYGCKIGQVNTAIEEIIPELQSLSDDNADAEIKVAVLEFASGVVWVTPQPIPITDFSWNYLNADGATSMGEAFLELADKLSVKKFMREATGSFAPAIFLMSDGAPTDDYRSGLDVLKQNNWFKAGIKIALAIGSDADLDVLTDFTGNKELVLVAHDAAQLRRMIKFIAVTSSQVASKSASVGADNQLQSKEDELVKEVQEFKQGETGTDEDVDQWV